MCLATHMPSLRSDLSICPTSLLFPIFLRQPHLADWSRVLDQGPDALLSMLMPVKWRLHICTATASLQLAASRLLAYSALLLSTCMIPPPTHPTRPGTSFVDSVTWESDDKAKHVPLQHHHLQAHQSVQARRADPLGHQAGDNIHCHKWLVLVIFDVVVTSNKLIQEHPGCESKC